MEDIKCYYTNSKQFVIAIKSVVNDVNGALSTTFKRVHKPTLAEKY